METTIKQTAGIDCGMQELVVSFGSLFNNGNFICKHTKAFTNTTNGFKQLRQWIAQVSSEEATLLYVMEATGVYHEKLAYYLVAHDQRVSIVLPNKVMHLQRPVHQKNRMTARHLKYWQNLGVLSNWMNGNRHILYS